MGGSIIKRIISGFGITLALGLGMLMYMWLTRFARMPWWIAALVVVMMLGFKLIGLGLAWVVYFWLRLRGWKWWIVVPLVSAPLAALGIALGVYLNPGASWTHSVSALLAVFSFMMVIIAMGTVALAELCALFRDAAIKRDEEAAKIADVDSTS